MGGRKKGGLFPRMDRNPPALPYSQLIKRKAKDNRTNPAFHQLFDEKPGIALFKN